MADLELAETSEAAPSALITRIRLKPFVSSTKAIRRPTSLVVAVAYRPKPIVPLCGAPVLPDAHMASLRDRPAEALCRSGVLDGDLPTKALCGSGVLDGDLLAEAHISSPWAPPLPDAHSASMSAPRVGLAKAHSASSWSPCVFPAKAHSASLWTGGVLDGDLLAEAHIASLWAPPLPDAHSASLWAPRVGLAKAHSASSWPPCVFQAKAHSASLWTECLLATMLSNQGESSGSGGRAGGERKGGGGDGNQAIGGGVGGGGQREGIGNERSNRGRNHGGGNGNGDDDGNDRRGLLGYIRGERGPIGPGPYGLAEILAFLNVQMIGTLASQDIHGLPARAMIYRVVSLGFNSVALVCLPASIGHRRTSPRLASILCLIASSATLLGFISMIAMAISASLIP